jgi:CRISPR-associated protein Csd1
VECCIRRASARHGNKNGNKEARRYYWEWEKTLGVTCALYKKQFNERGYSMSLDKTKKTRDYLYGRLLALAELLEERASFFADEKRETNAAKLMQRFADRPYSTWLTLETSLTPYKIRLKNNNPGFLYHVNAQIDEVMNSFKDDDFLSDKRLTGEFLLGYHCQRAYKEDLKSNHEVKI